MVYSLEKLIGMPLAKINLVVDNARSHDNVASMKNQCEPQHQSTLPKSKSVNRWSSADISPQRCNKAKGTPSKCNTGSSNSLPVPVRRSSPPSSPTNNSRKQPSIALLQKQSRPINYSCSLKTTTIVAPFTPTRKASVRRTTKSHSVADARQCLDTSSNYATLLDLNIMGDIGNNMTTCELLTKALEQVQSFYQI